MDIIIYDGLIKGFLAASIIGPISVLIIHRTLRNGPFIGWVSGLGVALADGMFGLVGGLGIVVLADFLGSNKTSLIVVSALILFILGIKIYNSPQIEKSTNVNQSINSKGYAASFTSIFFLTISNPLTVLYFASMYANMGVQENNIGYLNVIIFGAAIFLGSLTWWLILVGVVGWLRERFDLEKIRALNQLTGIVILGYAIWLLVSL